MRLRKNFVTWRHENYADIIRKINLQTSVCIGKLIQMWLCMLCYFWNYEAQNSVRDTIPIADHSQYRPSGENSNAH